MAAGSSSISRRHLLASLGPLLAIPTLAAAAPNKPGPRSGHVLVYHERRNAVCLLGGYDGRPPEKEEAWFWNGSRWEFQKAEGGGGPYSRTLAAAAFDRGNGTLAYVAGITMATRKPTGELWSLRADGRWDISKEGSPGPRDHHAAVYDASRKRIVVYGGQDAQRKWITDLWEVEGHKWKWIKSAVGPGERAHHAMAYDGRRGRTVLFGGFGRDSVYRGETWEWDGRQWTQVATDGPAPRARHRMVYDVMRGVTVLFGGDTGNPGPGRFDLSDETWLWDGSKWTKAAPQTAPSARMAHALAYDAGRSRVVLYGGGTGAAAFGDTWEWDGVNWRQVAS